MGEPLIANAGDLEQVKKAEKTVRGRENRLVGAFNLMLQTPHGRVIINWILRQSKVFDPKAGTDAGLQYYAGLAYIGVKTLEYLKKCDPKLYVELLTDERREERSNG